MTANYPVSPEGTVLTPNGWVTGKVKFAGHTISAVDGRMAAAVAKPKGPFVLPGFIDLHVHGGGGGDWQGGEEGVRTFVRYHASCGTTVMAPTTAIGSIPVIEKSLSAITSIAAVRSKPAPASCSFIQTPCATDCAVSPTSPAAIPPSRATPMSFGWPPPWATLPTRRTSPASPVTS